MTEIYYKQLLLIKHKNTHALNLVFDYFIILKG